MVPRRRRARLALGAAAGRSARPASAAATACPAIGAWGPAAAAALVAFAIALLVCRVLGSWRGRAGGLGCRLRPALGQAASVIGLGGSQKGAIFLQLAVASGAKQTIWRLQAQ